MFTLKLLLVASAILCVAQSTDVDPVLLPLPPNQCSNCNIWDRDYVWTIEDGVCRPFQNQCLLDEENNERRKQRKKALKPIPEDICRLAVPKKCPKHIKLVAAELPKPAECGCNGKRGSITIQVFDNLCLLQKFAVKNKTPYLAVSNWSSKCC